MTIFHRKTQRAIVVGEGGFNISPYYTKQQPTPKDKEHVNGFMKNIQGTDDYTTTDTGDDN